MDYSKIIKDSAQLFWKHKSLWVFGIIAALVGQGEYNFSVSYRESYPIDSSSPLPGPFGSQFADFFKNPLPYLVLLIGLSLLAWIIFGLIGWLAKGAIIGMVNEVDQEGTTSIKSGWKMGANRATPLFLISLLLALPQFIILIVVLALSAPIWLPVFHTLANSFSGQTANPDQMREAFQTMGSNFFAIFILACGLICVMAILSLVTNLWNILASRSCVLDNMSVFASLRKSARVATHNIGYILITWLILVIVMSIYGFIAAIPALALWIPTAQAFLHNSWSATSVITAILTAIYFLAMVVCLGGILTAFNNVLWTKLYKAFIAREIVLSNPDA